MHKVTGVEPNLWMLAEQAVRASATKISIPQGHIDALKHYAQANTADGRLLLNALDQDPSFYKGGWLLGAQGDAEAITFGNSIFFKDSPPTRARSYTRWFTSISTTGSAARHSLRRTSG